MNELIQELIQRLEQAENRIKELEENTGNSNAVLSGLLFPDKPYNNQIFCLTNTTPPDGGTLYRYDASVNSWLILIN